MNIGIEKTTNLDGLILPESLPGALYMNENEAHQFAISCTKAGQSVTLSGSVTGRFIRPDGQTVLLTGSITNGVAYVTLKQACYILPGRFIMAIFNIAGGATTTIYAATGNIARTQTGSIIDPGSVIPNIDDLLAEIDAMRQATAEANAAAEKSVRYDTAQTLSDANQATARGNIGAAADADVDELKSAFNQTETNLNAVFESGKKYSVSTSNPLNRVSQSTSVTKSCAVVPVIPLCTYEIGFCSYGDTTPAVLFADKYYTFISSINGESTAKDESLYVTAPADAEYMFVNHDANRATVITSPYIKKIVNCAYTDNKLQSSNDLITYMGADVHSTGELTSEGTYQARITTSGKVSTTTTEKSKVKMYEVVSGKTYIVDGTGVRLASNLMLCAFGESEFDGTNDCQTSVIIIDDESATVATNYHVVFVPEEDGYLYLCSHDDYPSLTVYNGEYNSTIIEGIKTSIDSGNSFLNGIIPCTPFEYSLDDLFESLESGFIDDFTARASFIDENHTYTMIGTEDVAPTITTGVGATRTLLSTGTNLWYSREIPSFPYFCLIGKVSGMTQRIKLFSTTSAATGDVSISGSNGAVQYGGNTYGNLHTNAVYHLLCIDKDGLTIFDDAGIRVTVPITYGYGKPKNIAMGFLGYADRSYGYGCFVELVKNQISKLDVERFVNYNQSGEPNSFVDSVVNYTHGVGDGQGGHSATWYKTPDDNPATEIVNSEYTNNLCVKLEADYSDDMGYRTEMAIRPIKSSLHNKLGGLQRIRYSADYYIDSNYNIDNGEYPTYIFQIHDSNFNLSGWTDAPPLHINYRNGKLYANVSYIADGDVPASDDEHETDVYPLGDFEFDKWHHIDIEARIGWKKCLAPRLMIKVDGVEKLNITTPLGFNIVSSDGWVNTHSGIYCPTWLKNTYTNMHREILIANVKWEGTQNLK